MAPAMHVHRTQRRYLRAVLLLVAILCCVWSFVATVGLAFGAVTLAAPEADRAARTSAESREAISGQRGERERNDFDVRFNHTLMLDTGRPASGGALIGDSFPWATCIVEYAAGAEDAENSLGSYHGLETWVMRGDRDVVSAFALWRHTAGEVAPESVRCSATRLASEDVRCLECISVRSPHGAASRPPAREGTARLRLMDYASRMGTPQGSSVLPSGGLSQCLARTARGAGFCKSGVLRI